MQALSLRPSFGWKWIQGGWRLFRGQPFGFIALLFFSLLLIGSASTMIDLVARAIATLLPFLPEAFVDYSGILALVFSPIFVVGYMQACRVASMGTGGATHPLLLFAALRAGRPIVKNLLVLGVVQAVALTLVITLTRTLEPVPQPATTTQADASSKTAPSPTAVTAPTEADLEQARRYIVARAVQGALYLPVVIVVWFAAMLTAWHGLSAGKALFFSMVGVWRNLAAFAVCGLGWLVVSTGLSLVFGIVTRVIGSPNVAVILAVPMALVLMTWMYCSMYPTFESVFVDDRQPTPPPRPDEPPPAIS